MFYANNVLTTSNVYSVKPIPPSIRKHVMLWRRLKIEFDESEMQPRSNTFTKLLTVEPPHLHPTPPNVPSIQDWPKIKNLHVPPSTKSFLLKVCMNALPTHDRLAYAGDDYQPYCPLCGDPLTSSHFFSLLKINCSSKNLSAEITKWTKRNGLITPSFKFRCGQKNTNYNLIFINTLWKTVCALNHSDKPMTTDCRFDQFHRFKKLRNSNIG